MRSAKDQVLETYYRLLDAWLSREDNALEKIMFFFDESFHGFGTTRHEIFTSRENLISQFTKEFEQLPDGGRSNIKWTDVKPLSETVFGIISEISLLLKINRRILSIDPIRISCVFKQRGKAFKMLQWHASAPDISSEEEVFPGSIEPKRYPEVTVFFTDFVGFTQLVSKVSPKKLVGELNEIFSNFDEIILQHGLDKIKTIGDAYMTVGGLKDQQEDHVVQCIRALKQMLRFLEERNAHTALKWEMRAGVHTGPVVGGIIGRNKLSFDLWGDTVNLASRLESASETGKINVSAYTRDLIKEVFPSTYRGKIATKDRGPIDMYFVQ